MGSDTMSTVRRFFGLEIVRLETLVLGNAWFSWEALKRIVHLLQGDGVTVSMHFPVLVLLFVSRRVGLIQRSSEGIWGDDLEVILSWKFGIHSVLFEEPLESVDGTVNVVLEQFILVIVEFLHLLLHLGSLLDEIYLLFLDSVVANNSFRDDVLFKGLDFILKEHSPPFPDNDEIVKELVLTIVKLVVCLLLVAIDDLNQRCSKVPILDFVNGLDGVVVESSHDVSVLMELLEDLLFIIIKFAASVFVFLEKE